MKPDNVFEEFFSSYPPKKEPAFVKLYLDDVGKLFSIDNTTQTLFGELLKLINPTERTVHNTIYLNKAIKEVIAKRLGWVGKDSKGREKKYYINQYLGKLCKARLIRKITTDVYIVNPFIASKVDWANIELVRAIHLNVTYDEISRTMVTIVSEVGKALAEEVEIMRKHKEDYDNFDKEDSN